MSAMKLCLVYLAVVLSCCEAYKILVIFPLPGKSHAILGDGIVRNLLNDGHEVTYIAPFPYKPATPNLRLIDVSSNLDAIPMDMMNFEALMSKEINFDDHKMYIGMFLHLWTTTAKHENVQKLLNDPKEQFDAVIGEWMFTDFPASFGAVFNCPFIWSSSTDIHWMVQRLIDQPAHPAYTEDIMSSNLVPLTFWQRVTELCTLIKVQILRYTIFNGLEKSEYDNILAPIIVKRGRQPPSYYDVQYNASLVLANTHVSVGQAVPLPQNYKPIGGYHIDEKVKPLPDDLKKIMDNAKNGVIYFSMGSNLKSKDIPKVLKESLLKMFGELKQTVFWKFEENIPNTPKNVHILNWAPQQSILSHPNLVVFITHGGLLSTTESIHFGVPTIGIPVFGDQFLNVVRAVKRGYAQKVDLSYTMVDELKAAIEEVTTNPKYAEKAKELSAIYHDRPVLPAKEISHWVKHVIKTRGAPHLRSPALNMPFYQRLYLDLIAIILVIIFALSILVKYVCCAFCSKNNVGSKKKTN